MKLHVLVAWASRSHQEAVRVVLPPAATVAAAVEASGLVARYGIDLRVRRIGINGRVVQPDTLVRDGDRVEIYRPLVSDPKAARRERVNAKSQQITQVKSKKN